MDHKELVISQSIQNITQDIHYARSKSWLKVAIVSHICGNFPQYSECDITMIVETWYAGAYE